MEAIKSYHYIVRGGATIQNKSVAKEPKQALWSIVLFYVAPQRFPNFMSSPNKNTIVLMWSLV